MVNRRTDALIYAKWTSACGMDEVEGTCLSRIIKLQLVHRPHTPVVTTPHPTHMIYIHIGPGGPGQGARVRRDLRHEWPRAFRHQAPRRRLQGPGACVRAFTHACMWTDTDTLAHSLFRSACLVSYIKHRHTPSPPLFLSCLYTLTLIHTSQPKHTNDQQVNHFVYMSSNTDSHRHRHRHRHTPTQSLHLSLTYSTHLPCMHVHNTI